ncbi:putative ribonuclease H-like domain-containing protein [Tanacetum coccineum]
MNKLAHSWIGNGFPQNSSQMTATVLQPTREMQHKASYKASLHQHPFNEPLHLQTKGPFCGSYFHQSIDHKYYSLVITDTLAENQLTKKVKAIRCDNGTEFKNSNLIELCGSKGIKRDYSVASIPHNNKMGPAERKNRTLKRHKNYLADSRLPTIDHLGKFEGKADEGFLVGYSAHSKAYRVYNLSNKRIEETLNLRYMEDKPNIQGCGVMNGTQDTNNHAGPQDDSDSESDEQLIVVPSFPSNHFSGPEVNPASDTVESTSDYAEELARLQRQEYEANTAATDTWNTADTVPAVSAIPPTSIPAGSINQAAGDTDVPSTPPSSVFAPVHTTTPLPPGHSLGSSENSTRFSSPSDLANHISSSSEMEGIHHHPTTGIFSASTYDADFGGSVTNLAPTIAVDPVPTRRVHTVHPISQIIGDITSPVLTRGTLKKSKFGESAFAGYVHDQQRNNQTDYLHCLFACFLS